MACSFPFIIRQLEPQMGAEVARRGEKAVTVGYRKMLLRNYL
jgi:hypothetical protein